MYYTGLEWTAWRNSPGSWKTNTVPGGLKRRRPRGRRSREGGREEKPPGESDPRRKTELRLTGTVEEVDTSTCSPPVKARWSGGPLRDF
jgi:hypothetical protein